MDSRARALMNLMGAAALSGSLGLTASPTLAAGDDPLVESARQLMRGAAIRGTWTHPLLAHAGGETGTPSADAILMAEVANFTRIYLDQGGWVNPYVTTPGYDAGNHLLAVLPGDGVRLGG